MVGTMMRVDELRDLTVGQMRVVRAQGDTHEHLLVDVVGKHGHRETAVVGELAARPT
jgi:hypothetical protein